MVVIESVTESVLSKVSGLSYKHESFTLNDNDGVSAGVCIWKIFRPFCG